MACHRMQWILVYMLPVLFNVLQNQKIKFEQKIRKAHQLPSAQNAVPGGQGHPGDYDQCNIKTKMSYIMLDVITYIKGKRDRRCLKLIQLRDYVSLQINRFKPTQQDQIY